VAQKGRLDKIREIIKQDKKVLVLDLSEQFGVTPETIRRDLEKLENEGLVVRTYGGAALNGQTQENSEKISFIKRSRTNVEEKRSIAAIAATKIPANASIGCDASSTVMELLSLLSEREDLLVLTNSASVIHDMENTKFEILSTGGLLNRQSFSMQGGVARTTIQEYHLDMVFISCKGINSNGIYDSHELEADVKKALIERGHKVFLLVDHTKFDRVAFMKLTELDHIDALITDREPEEKWMMLFNQFNIEVFYPGK